MTEKGQGLSDMTDPGSEDQSSIALVMSKSPTAEAAGLPDD